MDDEEGDDAEDASIPSPLHDVANASRRDLLRTALFDAPPVERRVGRFRVRGVLGRGGMGTVLEGHDEVLDRPVAIKLLHPTLAHREQRLLAEARALARLSHPHVVQVYEAGKAGDRIYIVMELVRGQTLRQWQDAERPGWRACVEAYVQAGRGLAAAHALDLVHRDFKPNNCIRDVQGRVRVLDFGLVRRGVPRASDSDVVAIVPEHDDREHDDATQPGVLEGTPAYMAPELLRSELADARSDQYSFCVALYEALLGRHPFGVEGAARREAIQRRVIEVEPRDASVPASIRRALDRGLSIEPSDRWPDMEALLRALDPGRRAERRIWQVVVVLGLAGGGALHAWVTSPPPPCGAPSPRLEQEWSPERQAAVAAGLRASGSPLAEATWERLHTHVDEYLAGWSESHAEICEATRVRGEQSDALMDRRMACLELQLDAVASLLRALEQADGDAVENATLAALRLPDPGSCRTDDEDDEPRDAATLALERRLVDLRTRVGLRQRGLTGELAALRQQAQAAGASQLAARALYVEGIAMDDRGEVEQADATLGLAAREALAAGDDETALEALLHRVQLVGAVRVDPSHALPELQWAHALLLRLDEPPAMRADYLTVAGIVLGRNGHYAEAQARLDEALALAPTLPEPRVPYERALSAAGIVAQLTGRLEDAEALLERLLAHDRVTYGERHPHVANTLNNLAVVEGSRGDMHDARQRLVEALAIYREALGSQHVQVADALLNLCGASLERPTEALAFAEEARAIYAASLGETAAKTLAADTARGWVEESLGRPAEAERLYRHVLAQQRRTLGERHPDLVPTLLALSRLLAGTDRAAEAAPLQELAAELERGTEPSASPSPP